jgi:hypothetical protein
MKASKKVTSTPPLMPKTDGIAAAIHYEVCDIG